MINSNLNLHNSFALSIFVASLVVGESGGNSGPLRNFYYILVICAVICQFKVPFDCTIIYLLDDKKSFMSSHETHFLKAF